MRSFIVIGVSLVVLIAGFFVYLRLQPRTPVLHPANVVIPPGPTPGPPNGPLIGPGREAWTVNIDKITGQIASRFKAEQYQPNPDGSIAVTRPVIEIFFSGGKQMLRIEGDDGFIQMNPGSDRGSMNGVPVEPPSRGNMHHVTMRLFPTPDATEPDMTLAMNNAEFENDTSRLYTEAYTDPATGKEIAGDRVPVTIHATDYDFAGQGLTVFWDDKDHSLKSIEIAHGKLLTIHSTKVNIAPTPAAPVSALVARPAAPPAGGTPPPPSAVQPHRYLAQFFDNVRIVQSDYESARADAMTVDINLKSRKQPAAGPAPASGSPPPSAAVTRPAGRPPVLVYWTGRLHIVPVTDPKSPPLPPGQAVVRLEGSPVHLSRPGKGDKGPLLADCASATYETASGDALLESSPRIPVTLTTSQLTAVRKVVCPSVKFTAADHQILMSGPGQARFADPAHANLNLDINWSKSCQLILAANSSNLMQLRSAHLLGKVSITSPMGHLQGDSVVLNFMPADPRQPDAAPVLRQVIADGDSHVAIESSGPDKSSGPEKSSIDSDHLDITTAQTNMGDLYAKKIVADGHVHAIEAGKDLTSGHLDFTISPLGENMKVQGNPLNGGDAQLDSLTAAGDVHLKTAAGGVAAADELNIVTRDRKERITLHGKPLASVGDASSTITGPIIHILPDEDQSSVEGPGTMTAIQQPAPGAPPGAKPHPLHIQWETAAAMDGNPKQNQILFTGNVHVESPDSSGPMRTAQGEQLTLFLKDKPTDAAADMQPAAEPDSENVMAGKEIRAMSLQKIAQIGSTESAADGTLLRRMAVLADKIDYDMPTQRMTVPGPGRMLVEDHSPAPTTHPAATQPATARGATAFQWARQLTFDQIARRMILEGSVRVVHQDDDPATAAFRMDAGKMTADFAAGMQLKHVLADGGVTMREKDSTIDSDSADFDPLTQRLVARGAPGSFTDDTTHDQATFGELWLNTQTDRVEKMVDLNAAANP